jgi:hypothetical protein
MVARQAGNLVVFLGADANADERAVPWSAGSGVLLRPLYACPSPSTASFSRAGNQVVVACPDGTVMVFAASGQRIATLCDPGSASIAEFNPDGGSIVTAYTLGDSGGVRIWDAELATYSRPALVRLAWRRIIPNLTPGRARGGRPRHQRVRRCALNLGGESCPG